MQLLSTILNTRFWLMAMGAFLVLFTGFALVSGQAANSASTFWAGELTERELNIAVVVEVVWFAHMLGMGAILLFLGLLAANPARARIGAIAVVGVMGTQFIAGGMASTYGYNGFSGFNIFAALFMLIPLITLIACLSKLNAK